MSTFACNDDEVDLKLGSIKSIQIGYGINGGYPEIGLFPDDLVRPFQAALTRRGIKIDQNNYDNVVDTKVDIAKKANGAVTTYAVVLKFSYAEPCVAGRAGIAAQCELWSDYEPIKIFTDPAEVKKYVLDRLNVQVAQFMKLFSS